jgi:hypothetical protein
VAIGVTALARPGAAQEAPPRVGAPDDDPGIGLLVDDLLDEAGRVRRPPRPPFPYHGGRFRLFYRAYQFDCVDRACWYQSAGLAIYPTAFLDAKGFGRAIRFGLGLAGAGENTQARTRWWQHHFSLEALVLLGLQYPARVTPYLELAIGLGAMHRNVYNQDSIELTYSFGLDAGLEIFLVGGLHWLGSVGWRRSIVGTGVTSRFADSVILQTGFGF